MNTVPYSGRYPGTKLSPNPNGSIRNPDGPGGVHNPNAFGSPFYPYGFNGSSGGARPNGQRGSRERFLNADPFDPSSVVNSYDRYRYANPYPYDPINNPYGQSPSPYAPMAPNVPMGQGMPFRR